MKRTASFVTQICLIFSLLFATASCKMVYSFESLTPAKYTLPQGLDTVLVVCGILPKMFTDTSEFVSPKKKAEIFDAEIKMPFVASSILYSEMNKYGFLPAKLYNLLINADTIPLLADSLCRATNTNAILVLSSMSYERTDKLYTAEGKPFVANKYRDDYFLDPDFLFIQTLVNASCQWSFVTPNGNRRNFEVVTTNPCWESSNDSSPNSLPGFRQSCFASASDLSFQMVGELTPSWTNVDRFIFYSHNRSFLNAVDMIEQNQWDDARSLLSTIYEKGCKKNKVRAALDMSLSFEKEGDIESASVWCSKALDILDNTKSLKFEREYAKELFNLLETRKKEIIQLDKQMYKRQ